MSLKGIAGMALVMGAFMDSINSPKSIQGMPSDPLIPVPEGCHLWTVRDDGAIVKNMTRVYSKDELMPEGIYVLARTEKAAKKKLSKV